MKWQLQLLIFSRSSDSNSNTVSHCYNSSSVPIIVWNPGSSMCLGELTVFFILSLFVCCICSCCSLCIISTFKIMTWIVSSISAFTVCLGSNGNIRYIVATHSQSLLVYENMTLRWAAQMNSTPVQIKVGTFKWVFFCSVSEHVVYLHLPIL